MIHHEVSGAVVESGFEISVTDVPPDDFAVKVNGNVGTWLPAYLKSKRVEVFETPRSTPRSILPTNGAEGGQEEPTGVQRTPEF